MWLLVVVMRADGVHHGGGNPVPLDKVGSNDGVRPLDLMVDGLADVVEKPRHLGEANVGADLRRHHGGQVGYFLGVAQYLLAVTGAEPEDAEMPDDLRV